MDVPWGCHFGKHLTLTVSLLLHVAGCPLALCVTITGETKKKSNPSVCGHLFIMAFGVLGLGGQVLFQTANEIKAPPAGPDTQLTPERQKSRLLQKQTLLGLLHKSTPSSRQTKKVILTQLASIFNSFPCFCPLLF